MSQSSRAAARSFHSSSPAEVSFQACKATPHHVHVAGLYKVHNMAALACMPAGQAVAGAS